MDCLGCRIANGLEPGINVVYENEWISCVLNLAPFNEGHTLILPKKHFRDLEELDNETVCAILAAVNKLSAVLKHVYSPDGICLHQGAGKFDDLHHYHVHVIPRNAGEKPDIVREKIRCAMEKERPDADMSAWMHPAAQHKEDLRKVERK